MRGSSQYVLQIQLAFLCCCALLFSEPSLARIKSKIELAPDVASRLSRILKQSQGLYAALIEKNESAVIKQLDELQNALFEAEASLQKRYPASKDSHPPFMHASNLKNVFQSMKHSIQQVKQEGPGQRRDDLRALFKQIVLVENTYKTGEDYRTYFCKRDRSVWLQKGGKPKNPILVDIDPSCGAQIKR